MIFFNTPDFADYAVLIQEYEYDDKGNMTRDENKGISIFYNRLNLAEEILFKDNNKIEYLYDASGNKLVKLVYSNDTFINSTDYLGMFVYENDTLDHIHTGKGRIVPQVGSAQYEYFISDHLGNVRVSFTKGTNKWRSRKHTGDPLLSLWHENARYEFSR